MPVFLGYLLFAGPLGSIFSFGALVAASQLALGLAINYGIGLLRGKPAVPKPADGKYNLNQNVPSDKFILGRVRKAADYLALEEKGTTAYHVYCYASHRINGFVTYYLHDEIATFNGSGIITTPTHFNGKVTIKYRLGLNAETAYSELTAAFPTLFTADHRGDGLATILMMATSVDVENQQKVFTQGMPQLLPVIEGALLYDPRNGAHNPLDNTTWTFSTNVALERLWHLTSVYGPKLSISDLYLPDWINAANVCDQTVTNKAGGTESRYHGGIWAGAENDQVQIGMLLDQAAEMVLYERPDGLVGVHAGEWVEPTIRLTADTILKCSFDANRRQASTVLAVRGRFTDPSKDYNTVDAAIYGSPYGDDTERTKTVDNLVVQSHNHMARLQTLAFKRSNAPRVSVICDYESAEDLETKRWVKVHYPPKLEEAYVEIIGRPRLSLKNLTYEFDGIVVQPDFYTFVAATDEGTAASPVVVLPKGVVPVPTGFGVVINTDEISAGVYASYAYATWDFYDATLTYELQWRDITPGSPIQSTRSTPGVTTLRSAYLQDTVTYAFKLRTWSAGTSSEWTAEIELLVNVSQPIPTLDFSKAANSQYFGAM